MAKTLLDKLVKKDYNNDLEEVLTKKAFPEEVKNLLLEILYKVEVSYKDYETVKKNVLSKDEYIENIIKSIKSNCDSIQLITPADTKKRKLIVNKEKKQIACYPMSNKLLYAIAKIQKSDDIIEEETEIVNKSLTNTINIGNSISMVEPLRDFNGFAWSRAVLDIESVYYNLIYQDLNLLGENTLIEEWANNHDEMVDYMGIFKENLEKKYGKKIADEVLNLLKRISILLELNTNKLFKKDIIQKKLEVEAEFSQMEDREKYLDDLSKYKKEIVKKIRGIDIILSDKEKLACEYNRRNMNLPIEQKIFSKRVFAIKLIEERDRLISQMQKCNEKMDSKNFLYRQNYLKYELKYLKLADIKDIEKETLEEIVLLQKRIIQALKIRIKETKTRECLTKILYEIRYFNLIPISITQNVGQISKLNKMFMDMETEAISKAYELKAFNEICKDRSLNANILKYIFSLDIIKMEDITLKLVNEKDGIYVQFFDDDIVDKKMKLDFDLEKEDLRIRFNKKIKLFDL